MATNQQNSGTASQAQATGSTTLPGWDGALDTVLKLVQGVGSKDMSNVLNQHQDKSAEMDAAIAKVQEQLLQNVAIVNEGVAVQQKVAEAQGQLNIEEINDEEKISEATRTQLSSIDEAMNTIQKVADAQVSTVNDLTNYMEGKDAQGKPSLLRKVMSTLFPGDVRRARDEAANEFANRMRDKALLEQTKSQTLSNAAAQSALLTSAEAEAKRNLVKTQTVMNSWNIKADAATKNAAILQQYAGLTAESLKNINQQFEMLGKQASLNVDLANTIIQREYVKAQISNYDKETDKMEAWRKSVQEYNALYGTNVNPDTAAQLAATGQWEQIEKMAGSPDEAKFFMNYLVYRNVAADKAKMPWAERINLPESTLDPSIAKFKKETARYLAATGQDSIDKEVERELAKRGITVAPGNEDKVKEVRDEVTAQILSAAQNSRMDTAGLAVASLGEIVIGEQQWVDMGMPPEVAKALAANTPHDLKTGQVKDAQSLYEKVTDLKIDLEERFPELGNTLSEIMPTILAQQVANGISRNFPNVFGADNLQDAKLIARSGDRSILFGGTGESMEFDLSTTLGLRNAELLRRAQRRYTENRNLLNPPELKDYSNLKQLVQRLQQTQASK